MKKKDIISKLDSIMSEGTKNVTKSAILENEKRALQEELGMMREKVSQWLIDSFIEGVKNNGWSLYHRDKNSEDYYKLMTAAEEVILSTDSGNTTPEELIDAAQEYAFNKSSGSLREDDADYEEDPGEIRAQRQVAKMREISSNVEMVLGRLPEELKSLRDMKRVERDIWGDGYGAYNLGEFSDVIEKFLMEMYYPLLKQGVILSAGSQEVMAGDITDLYQGGDIVYKGKTYSPNPEYLDKKHPMFLNDELDQELWKDYDALVELSKEYQEERGAEAGFQKTYDSIYGDDYGSELSEKRDIVSKLSSIISEGTKGVTRRTILENEKKALIRELGEMGESEEFSITNIEPLGGMAGDPHYNFEFSNGVTIRNRGANGSGYNEYGPESQDPRYSKLIDAHINSEEKRTRNHSSISGGVDGWEDIYEGENEDTMGMEESGHYDSSGMKIYGRMSDGDYMDALGQNYDHNPYSVMDNDNPEKDYSEFTFSDEKEAIKFAKESGIENYMILNTNADW